MDRAAWEQAVTRALEEHEEAFRAFDTENLKTRTHLPIEFEPLDEARLDRIDQLRRVEEEKWRHLRALLASSPDSENSR